MATEQALVETHVTPSKYSKRVLLKTILGRTDGGLALIGQRVVIGGWVKSSREVRKDPLPRLEKTATPDSGTPQGVTCVEVLQSRLPFFKSILRVLGAGEHRIRDKLDAVLPKPPQPSTSILQLSDGSCIPSLQVAVDSTVVPPSQVMPTGACVLVEGMLQKPDLHGKQIIELKVEKVLHVGTVDQDRYPLSKKRLPLENLRDSAHFRPRTTTVASVMRIRSALMQATHQFFQENGFMHVEVPIITSTDCEGRGETFHVTTLLNRLQSEDSLDLDEVGSVKLESIKAAIKEKTKKVEELNRTNSNKEAVVAAIQDLKKATDLVSQLETKEKSKSGKSVKINKVNFSDDFFSRQTFLTSSGRLHLESFSCALGNVYTVGPRFRANKMESKKFLAEMWMAELEMAFSELEDAMDCASDFLKFTCKWTLENCLDDLKFVAKRVDKTVMERLDLVVTSSFKKISYTEAIGTLKQVTDRKFETEVEWGTSLSEEHESYLTDEIHKTPIIIYNHPKELKPFHTRMNDDGKTVATFDLVVPKVGTLIRGSQNEERFDRLNTRIKELGLSRLQHDWYLDLHRNGTAKCSGFSFLFDPLVLYATGLNDVRDAVPFPRSLGKANN